MTPADGSLTLISATDGLKTQFERTADVRSLEHELDGDRNAMWQAVGVSALAGEYREGSDALDEMIRATAAFSAAYERLTRNNLLTKPQTPRVTAEEAAERILTYVAEELNIHAARTMESGFRLALAGGSV